MIHDSISLYSLNKRIQEKTQQAFPDFYWVVGEILEISVNRTGHCYIDLIEKSSENDKIIARSRATIWAFKFRMLRPYFESTTGTRLQAGIKVLLKAEVSFHEIYGMSLNIHDIDPTYTMGELAMRKQEVIKKLTEDGIINMNKELAPPFVPQNIAVISAETAAGYGDFLDSLLNNNQGFYFAVRLFPAVVQGDHAESSIINALEEIFQSEIPFDAVVLIRGGGAQADLDCFNRYELAMNIAQFPIPLLTGIGHERDETIADIVAHRSFKTPTAVAEFLIDEVLDFSSRLLILQDRADQIARWIVHEEKIKLQQITSNVKTAVQNYLNEERYDLAEKINKTHSKVHTILIRSDQMIDHLSGKMQYLWKSMKEFSNREIISFDNRRRKQLNQYLNNQKSRLSALEKTLNILHPQKVIERGYSITYKDNKVVKSKKELQLNDKIETLVSDGKIISTVKKI